MSSRKREKIDLAYVTESEDDCVTVEGEEEKEVSQYVAESQAETTRSQSILRRQNRRKGAQTSRSNISI